MASSTSTLLRQNGLLLLPAIAKLARWRFKQMWRFLLVTWLGMLAMVVLACAPPLFSRVAVSADLRAVAANSPDGQNIIVQVISLSPTTAQVQQIAQQLDRLLKQGSLGTYLQAAPHLVVQTPPLDVLSTDSTSFKFLHGGAWQGQALPLTTSIASTSVVSSGRACPCHAGLVLDGYDPVQAAQHITVVRGRLPQATTDNTVEIALPQDLANSLAVHVGSIIQANAPGVRGLQPWALRVVGIIAPRSAHDPFWLADANPFGSLYSVDSGSTAHNVLAAREAVRSKIAALQTPPGKDATHLFWSYPFDLAHLDANTIPALSQQTSDLDAQIASTLPEIQGVTFASPGGSLFETLSNYAQHIVILEAAITFLLLLTLAIILFLVSMLSDMLVERQASIIATLRSRGATQQHVFGTFVAQGLVVGLAALLVGPLLAILLVRSIAQALLSPANQASLSVITNDPLQAALDVMWFAVVAVGVALLVMIVAISRSSKLDIVTLRRESSRTRRVPFWRRFNLDLFVVLLIVGGYVVYTYLWQSFTTAQAFDPLIYNLLKIGGFIAPPLLVAAAPLLFLRLFPLILRLATSLTARKRSAPAILAFAQMERAARPAARVIVLLALAIAATCFLLTLITTKQARTSEDATFAVGADFSGPLPTSDAFKTFDTLKTQYSTLPGVQSATLGYSDELDNAVGDIHIFAPDADTYAHTALWSTQNAPQPLADLNAQLLAHRSDAIAHNVVYALIDATLAQKYGLAQGDSFTLTMNETGTLHVHFIALALINYIPGSYNAPVDPDSDIGLVVDYQNYAAVYAKGSGMTLAPNYVWLRTTDDAAALAHIRNTLPGLQDRRMLTTANQENSVHLDIIGVLAIGVTAALILALIGTLLASWLNASSRLTNFAIMRALGMAPRQVAAVLLWEQGFVYLLALLLGTGLGVMLINFAAPAVSLLDLTGPSSQYNPFDIPPVQTIIPYSQLFLLLAGIVIICLVALLLMARIVSRPSLSQTLRLNED